MSADILAKVIEIAADTFDVDPSEITATSNLRDDLGAESLDLVEFSMELGEEFGGEMDEEGFSAIKTIQDVINHVTPSE